MFTPRITRTAAVQVRGSAGLLWAHLYWPSPAGTAPPLLVYFPSLPIAEAGIRRLCRRTGLIVLAAPAQYGLADAKAVVGWAADHAAELDADPTRLLIGGSGPGAELAAQVSRIASEEGWPELSLLTDLHTPLEGANR